MYLLTTFVLSFIAVHGTFSESNIQRCGKYLLSHIFYHLSSSIIRNFFKNSQSIFIIQPSLRHRGKGITAAPFSPHRCLNTIETRRGIKSGSRWQNPAGRCAEFALHARHSGHFQPVFIHNSLICMLLLLFRKIRQIQKND